MGFDFQVGECVEIWGQQFREYGSSMPFPHTTAYVSLHLAVDSYPLTPFVINQEPKVGKGFLSSVSLSSKLIKPKESTEREHGGNLQSVASRSEAQVTTWAWEWHLNWRAVSWD